MSERDSSRLSVNNKLTYALLLSEKAESVFMGGDDLELPSDNVCTLFRKFLLHISFLILVLRSEYLRTLPFLPLIIRDGKSGYLPGYISHTLSYAVVSPIVGIQHRTVIVVCGADVVMYMKRKSKISRVFPPAVQ